jgi:hypothetical protein
MVACDALGCLCAPVAVALRASRGAAACSGAALQRSEWERDAQNRGLPQQGRVSGSGASCAGLVCRFGLQCAPSAAVDTGTASN